MLLKAFRAHQKWKTGGATISIIIFLLLILCFESSAKSSAPRVTLSEKNTALTTVLKKIAQQTGLYFWYENNLLNNPPKTSIEVKNPELTSASQITAAPPAATISGTVKDSSGNPLPGATVQVKGTKTGTATNVNGQFSINASSGDVLIISFVGYQVKEVTITGEGPLNIVLMPSRKELEAFVVTGLGIKKETRSTVYNVQSISGSQVNEVKSPNFVNSLNGKVAGATFNASSSGVGGSVRVVLRGIKSISGNNNALYVVDGIPLPNLFTGQPQIGFGGSEGGEGITNINPDDIESISVLTGAAAAAIYGGQAANGVVLITTKKGKIGKTTVNVSSNTTFTTPFVIPEFQNTYGTVPPDPGSSASSFISYGPKLSQPSAYKVRDFFKTGVNYDNAINVSTGSEKSQSYFSVASTNATGIISNNKFNRYNFTARNTSDLIADKLTLDVSAMYVMQELQNMPAAGQYHNPLVGVYLFPPAGSVQDVKNYERFDIGRNFKTQYWPYGDLGMEAENPYWIINRERTQTKRERFLGTVSLKYTITDGLTLTGRVKYDNSNDVSSIKYMASTIPFFAQGLNGFYNTGRTGNKQTYADVLLNYTRKIKDISINATLGSSILDNKYSDFYSSGPLKVANYFALSNIGTADKVTTETLPLHNQTQAVFADVQIGYKNMLFLDVTGRNDWASALAYTTNTAVFYPSFGLSGIISDMVKLPDVISFLKLRATYSEVGNAPQPYIANPTYAISNGVISTVNTIPFTTLKPERTKSVEAGIDLRMFSNKGSLSVTLYNANTINQIFTVGVTGGVGVSSYYINAGKVNNKGIEASLGYNAAFGKLTWNPLVTFSLNRGIIKALLASYTDPVSGQIKRQDTLNVGGVTRLITGRGTADIYVSDFQRDNNGAIMVNADGIPIVNTQQPVRVGSVNPDYTIGFNNNFSYRNFNLSFLVNARVGGELIANTQAVMDAYGVSKRSAVVRDNGGVDVSGKLIPAKDYFTVTQTALAQYTYSATNVRLGELSLGYAIPAKLLNNKVQGIKLALIAHNLWMIYNKAPVDPEITSSTGTFGQGNDYFNQPSLRSIGFKLNVAF